MNKTETNLQIEHFDNCQMGGRLGGYVKKGKVLRNTFPFFTYTRRINLTE